MSTYAWVDLGALLVPLLFSFHPRLRFDRRWRAFAVAALGMMGLFIPWDALFADAGVWGFTPAHVWNIRWMGLPVEEWLFFVCVPYACLFTYHCFQVLGIAEQRIVPARAISLALALPLLALALWHWQRAYTSTAFALCALWIVFTAFVQRASWLGRFYFTYAALLLPFLVVNGILTGTGLERPVVWYDDGENLGLRILTIPVEDVFYGMLMVGLTTSLYEAWLSRNAVHSQA